MAIETAGTYSEGTKNIVRDIGNGLTEATGDQRERVWQLSVAILLAFFAEKEKGNVILEVNFFFQKQK